MSHVMVSYKREDEPRVAVLVRALRANGLEVWWDQGLPGGEAWRANIEKALDDARCVVVAWSYGSTGPDGGFVRDEAARALLTGAGYVKARSYSRLVRSFDPLEPLPPAPGGLRLRSVDVARDAARLHALDAASFAGQCALRAGFRLGSVAQGPFVSFRRTSSATFASTRPGARSRFRALLTKSKSMRTAPALASCLLCPPALLHRSVLRRGISGVGLSTSVASTTCRRSARVTSSRRSSPIPRMPWSILASRLTAVAVPGRAMAWR